jgi:hypothetical protein
MLYWVTAPRQTGRRCASEAVLLLWAQPVGRIATIWSKLSFHQALLVIASKTFQKSKGNTPRGMPHAAGLPTNGRRRQGQGGGKRQAGLTSRFKSPMPTT